MGRGGKAFVEDGGHQEKLGFKLSTNLVANFGSVAGNSCYMKRTVRYSLHLSMEHWKESVKNNDRLLCRRGFA